MRSRHVLDNLENTDNEDYSVGGLTLTAPPFLMLPPTKTLPASLGCFGSLHMTQKVLLGTVTGRTSSHGMLYEAGQGASYRCMSHLCPKLLKAY